MCPDVQWVHRLYKAAFEAEFGPSGGRKMAEQLEKTVSEYNVGGNKASLIHVGNDTVIAVCSAFMQRVHTLPTAGQTCFLDSSGNVDRYNCRVFLVMIDSVAGGLPVGVLITTSESEAVVTAALEEYKKLISSDAFGEEEPAAKRSRVEPAVDNGICVASDDEVSNTSHVNVKPNCNDTLDRFHSSQEAYKLLLSATPIRG